MEHSTITYTSATSATSAKESPFWTASSTQPVDTSAPNGTSNYGTWNGAGPYDDKSTGSSMNFAGTAAPCASPVHQKCLICLEYFDPAENGPWACAVPHACPIHTLIAGDKALYPAIYLPCCGTGRLNMPGLHPPYNPICRYDRHKAVIPPPFGGERHPPPAGCTPPSPAAANPPQHNGLGLVVGWQA